MRFPKAAIRALGQLHGVVYRITGGRGVGTVGPAEVLLLTTTGRRSRKPRTVPLLFVRDGEDFVVVASFGGHDTSPAWWRNLQADASARIRIGPRVVEVSARELVGAERARLWAALVAVYPDYESYRSRTSRSIPVIALRPR